MRFATSFDAAHDSAEATIAALQARLKVAEDGPTRKLLQGELAAQTARRDVLTLMEVDIKGRLYVPSSTVPEVPRVVRMLNGAPQGRRVA